MSLDTDFSETQAPAQHENSHAHKEVFDDWMKGADANLNTTDNTRDKSNSDKTDAKKALTFPSDKGDKADKGLVSIEAGKGNDVEAEFDASQRKDGMTSFKRVTTGSDVRTEQLFQGRDDQMTRQLTSDNNGKFLVLQNYDSEKRADGLRIVIENYNTNTKESRFDSDKRDDHLERETRSLKGSGERVEREFGDRPDGLTREVQTNTASGAQQNLKVFKDGSTVEEVKTVDGSKITTKTDSKGETQQTVEPPPKGGDQPQRTGDDGKEQRQSDGGNESREKKPPENKDDKDKAEADRKKQIDEDLKKFRDKLEGENKLPPLRKGEGPYQAIQRAIKEGKLPKMSHEEIKNHAIRIRDRDLKNGKTSFREGERLDFNSKEDINKKVDAERKRLEEVGKKSDKEPGRDETERKETDEGYKDPRLDEARRRLEATADDTIKDAADRKLFADNMRKFEDRARREGLSVEEVLKTYDNIDKLMGTKDGFIPQDKRAILANNAMYHLADPSNIDQGQFNTCNVTTMQEKLFTTHPSMVADILTQSALQGKYVAPNGRVIQLDRDSMEPVRNGYGKTDVARPLDGNRSYATQVLNHAMVNEITQRREPPQFYKQLHRDADGKPLRNGDSGERLIYADGKPCFDSDGKLIDSPDVSMDDMAESMERFTGERDVFLMNDEYGKDRQRMRSFGSPQELADRLKSGKMPVIIYVNGRDEAFGGSPNGEHGAHVVTIRDYDPKTGMVTISNQWGSKNDIKVPLDKLFKATKARPRVDGKIDQERKAG